MSLFTKYAPPLGSMQLIAFIAVFIALPFFIAPAGLQFAVFTLAFIVGVQPHINRLSEDGHKIHFALNQGKIFGYTLWKRKEWSIRLHISDKKVSNSLATMLVLLFTFLCVPVMLYIIYKATGIFAERIDARWDTITLSLAASLDWARAIAPKYVPEGDTSTVFSGVFADLVGDAKHFVTEVSSEIAAVIGHLVKAWFEIIIAMILLGVLIQNWHAEVNSLKWRIENGITNQTAVRRIFRFGKLYQDALSILILGYIEVAFTLSIYYFLALIIFPLNLGIGFIIATSLIFGFATAVPKIGGIAIKIISPFVMILYFQDGFGYFGYTFTLGLGIDLLIKAVVMFAIAFLGGYLEAYEYTPEKIGKKLGITKMEMVMTILIWAIGAKFIGMIYGVLLMLLVPAFTKLLLEEKTPEDSDEQLTLPLTESK
jgi:predicted PurR-regulated permease PerM